VKKLEPDFSNARCPRCGSKRVAITSYSEIWCLTCVATGEMEEFGVVWKDEEKLIKIMEKINYLIIPESRCLIVNKSKKKEKKMDGFSGSQREQLWKEITQEKKIERMRDIIKSIQRDIDQISRSVGHLSKHDHKDGEIVIPVKNIYNSPVLIPPSDNVYF